MEKPYQGRAILKDNFNELELLIPTKKNWFVIVFTGAWLGAWALSEIYVIGMVTGFSNVKLEAANFFMIFWLCGWTVGGFFVIRNFFWNLLGKEVVLFSQGQVEIARKWELFSKAKTYDLNHVKNFRIQEEESRDSGFWGTSRNFGAWNSKSGTLRFDYGMRTIKFGIEMEEAEAKFILEKLLQKHLVKKEQLQSLEN